MIVARKRCRTEPDVLAHLMNKIAGDVHDEARSVPANFDQLRAASEKLSTYMLSHMGNDPERALARRLLAELMNA